MGMIDSILIYTHSEYMDVATPTIDIQHKYFPDASLYVAIDKRQSIISQYGDHIFYPDDLMYTNRLICVLDQMDSDVILFLHDDMPLYNTPNYDLLDSYWKMVSDSDYNSIKLIAASDGPISDTTNNLIQNGYSKFSIQPTIINRKYLMELCNTHINKRIWAFEHDIVDDGTSASAFIGTEAKRGIHHYDSIVYPYIATAITKGKWNYTEYPVELDELFLKYGIDKEIRGVV